MGRRGQCAGSRQHTVPWGFAGRPLRSTANLPDRRAPVRRRLTAVLRLIRLRRTCRVAGAAGHRRVTDDSRVDLPAHRSVPGSGRAKQSTRFLERDRRRFDGARAGHRRGARRGRRVAQCLPHLPAVRGARHDRPAVGAGVSGATAAAAYRSGRSPVDCRDAVLHDLGAVRWRAHRLAVGDNDRGTDRGCGVDGDRGVGGEASRRSGARPARIPSAAVARRRTDGGVRLFLSHRNELRQHPLSPASAWILPVGSGTDGTTAHRRHPRRREGMRTTTRSVRSAKTRSPRLPLPGYRHGFAGASGVDDITDRLGTAGLRPPGYRDGHGEPALDVLGRGRAAARTRRLGERDHQYLTAGRNEPGHGRAGRGDRLRSGIPRQARTRIRTRLHLRNANCLRRHRSPGRTCTRRCQPLVRRDPEHDRTRGRQHPTKGTIR